MLDSVNLLKMKALSKRMAFGAAALPMAFALALLSLAPAAKAAEYQMGDLNLFIDTVLSAGASVRVQSRDSNFLSAYNGGANTRRARVFADPSRLTVIREANAATGDTLLAVPSVLPVPIGSALLDPADPTIIVPETLNYENAVTLNGGPNNNRVSFAKDFAAGVNTDHGNLNFDKGDLIGAPVKMTNDITASWGRWTAFFRVNTFYDAVLDDESSYERAPITNGNALSFVGSDFELLDAYVSGDFDVFEYPLNLRVGKQVINWGESTFYFSGNSVASYIDVSAARRPGAELKEILLPENAVYASMGLPYDLTIEAYALLDATPYELDPEGSPFSTSDVAVPGSIYGDRLELSGSSRTGTFRNNCTGSGPRVYAAIVGDASDGSSEGGFDLPSLPDSDPNNDLSDGIDDCADVYAAMTEVRTGYDMNQATAGSYTANTGNEAANEAITAVLTAYTNSLSPRTDGDDDTSQTGELYVALQRAIRENFLDPLAANPVASRLGGDSKYAHQGLYDYRVDITPGQGETSLREIGNFNNMPRLPDLEASKDGQYGVALRWYSEFFNSTEFGLYFQNVHSKLPIARAIYYERPIVGIGVTGVTTSGGAGLNAAGCTIGGAGFLANGAFSDPDLLLVQDTTSTDGLVASGVANALGGYDFDGDGDIGDAADTAWDREDAGIVSGDIFRLSLNPVYFPDEPGNIGEQDDGTPREGLASFLKYAAFADRVLFDWFNRQATVATGDAAEVTRLEGVRDSFAGDSAAQPTSAGGTAATSITASVKKNSANRYDVARINCALALFNTAQAAAGSPLAVNGAEYLSIQHRQAIQLIYPEDIKVWGFSFATTWGDWGIQGDFAYRENQPLAVDFTEQIITGAGHQGVGLANGDAQVFALTPLGTQSVTDRLGFDEPASYWSEDVPGLGGLQRSTAPHQSQRYIAVYEGCDEYGLVDGNVDNLRANNGFCTSRNLILEPGITPRSVFRADVYTLNLSAVNTYSASNGFVNAMGADLGVILAEVGFVYAPDLPQSRDPDERVIIGGVPSAPKGVTLASLCRAGTELPLGGLLNLDTIANVCSPDKTSWGYTILGYLDHSNLLGTAWNMRSQMVFSHGVRGNSPSPFSIFRENRYSATLSFDFTYQNIWSAEISYTNFFGRSYYSLSSDRDFVGASLSYSF